MSTVNVVHGGERLKAFRYNWEEVISSLFDILSTLVAHCAGGPSGIYKQMRVETRKTEEMCTHTMVIQKPEIQTDR